MEKWFLYRHRHVAGSAKRDKHGDQGEKLVVLGDGGPRHQEVLRALLAAGASTRLADRQGNTPLALARSRGYTAMVQMLQQAGAT